MEPELVEYWGNEEIIAVSQSFRAGGPYQGGRIVGGDLMYDKKAGKGSGANVWGKLLPDGAFALGFVSNEDTPTDVTCDEKCFANMTATSDEVVTGFTVRDLWLHEDHAATLKPPFTLTAKALPPHGGVAVFKLTPVKVG